MGGRRERRKVGCRGWEVEVRGGRWGVEDGRLEVRGGRWDVDYGRLG